MKKEIKINKLCGWTMTIKGTLQIVATFNRLGIDSGYGDLSQIETYVYGRGNVFDGYTTRRPEPDTLEIYIDNELALSITMCTVNELVTNNENY